MKTKEELWKEVQGRGWETIVDVIQRDAFQAGAEAEQKAILNDVWGSWAQSPVEKMKIVPFPEDK